MLDALQTTTTAAASPLKPRPYGKLVWQRCFHYWKLKTGWLSTPLAKQPTKSSGAKLLIWGGKRSGKTTLMYRWKLGVCIPTVTTVGLLEESFTYEQLRPTTKEPGLTRVRTDICLAELGRDPASLEVKVANPRKDELLELERLTNSVAGDAISRLLKSICCCCRRRRRRHNLQGTDYVLKLWSNAVSTADAVVYVVDSSNRVGMAEVFEDLSMIMHNDQLTARGVRILILANKQDVCNAMTPDEIAEMLDLRGQDDRVKVMGCSGLIGTNVNLAMEWLHEGLFPRGRVCELTASGYSTADALV